MSNEITIELNVFKALCLALGDDDATENLRGHDLGGILFEQAKCGPIAVATDGVMLTCASLVGAKIEQSFVLMGARKILKKAEKRGCAKIIVRLASAESTPTLVLLVDDDGVLYVLDVYTVLPTNYPTTWRHATPKPGKRIGVKANVSPRLLKVVAKQSELLCPGFFPGTALYQGEGCKSDPIAVEFSGCDNAFSVITGLSLPVKDAYTYPFDARQVITSISAVDDSN